MYKLVRTIGAYSGRPLRHIIVKIEEKLYTIINDKTIIVI